MKAPLPMVVSSTVMVQDPNLDEGVETCLDWYLPERVGRILKQCDLTLEREIKTIGDIATGLVPGTKPSDITAAWKHLGNLREQSLRMSGRVAVREKSINVDGATGKTVLRGVEKTIAMLRGSVEAVEADLRLDIVPEGKSHEQSDDESNESSEPTQEAPQDVAGAEGSDADQESERGGD